MNLEKIRNSISGRTLFQVGIGVTLIIMLSTALTYRLIYDEVERRTLDRLREYAGQRTEFHQSHFDLAREIHEVVKTEFIKRYLKASPDSTLRFGNLISRYPDGAWRNAPKFSDVSKICNGWINRNAVLDAEFKRVMMIGFDLCEQYSKMVSQRMLNIYFMDPKGLSSMGWEDISRVNNRRWIYETPADYAYPGVESYEISLPAANPARRTRWASPYFESGYRKVLISAVTPIYVGERLIAIVGTDDLIENLTRSILQSQIPDTTHSVFGHDGRLIADAANMDNIIKHEKGYWIRDTADLRLKSLLAVATAKTSTPAHGYDAQADHYYAIGHLNGPDWFFASTMPGHLVRTEAFRSAQWVLWAGFASLTGLLTVLALILKRQVDGPLRSLIRATRLISQGKPVDTREFRGAGELGRLLTDFGAMSHQVAERDQALRAEKERFRALTEHGADFIVVMDAEGINRYVSPTVETLLGHKPEDVLGRSPFDLMHRDDRDRLREAFLQCRKTPYARTGPLRYRTRNSQGEWRWMECSGTNLMESPAVRGFVVNQHDITEQVAAEEELERQRDVIAQRERLASMGSLLAGVAHELNNPLSVVVGRAVMLEEETADPSIQATARRIRSAAERCARIVRTFLAMARRSHQERSTVDMESVIDSALEMVEYSLKANGVELVREKYPGLPALFADADQLHQVLVNLFINAYQAMADSPNPRLLKISTRLSADAKRVQVEVADTGPGIPEALRGRIFDPYVTTKAVGSGTGVGLSVSLGIVEAHEGTLAVECPTQGGSRFTVSLPVSQATPMAQAPQLSRTNDFAELRVLAVDDEPEIREMLADILRHAGAAVDLAGDGLQALSLLGHHTYDAVLTDLRMPNLDGAGLYREIQARWPSLIARVAFISGDSLSGSVPHFIAGTGRPMIEKPFDPQVVIQTVQELSRYN